MAYWTKLISVGLLCWKGMKSITSHLSFIHDDVIKKVTLSMIKDKVRTGSLPVKTDFIHGLFSNLSGHWGGTEGGREGGGVSPFVQLDFYYNG